MKQQRNKLIIILGPTAVGKTDYAIEQALKIGSPILNCDSRQIYSQLQIGTAVPSEQQLRQVKHYFIQTHSITEHYTAGKYELEALALLENLFKEQNEVIMCGGSGLYIDAVCNGLDAFPEPDLQLRSELNRTLEQEGIESLRYQLKKLDQVSYEAIDIANPQRVIRALEVCLQTGRKFSDWKSSKDGEGAGALAGKSRNFEIEKIGLTMEREQLYNRINQRVDKMMQEGLLEEVRGLNHFRYKDGIFSPSLNHIPALRTVGYRELFDYIDGRLTLEEAIERIKMNTRRYAKRQLSYWGRDKSIKWIKL